MIRTGRNLVVLIVTVLLAGCAKGGATTAVAPSSETSAPAPTADAVTGSISGLVVDEEENPIVAVAVTLLEAQATATTDAGGRFTLNGLTPQTYRVHAERLGYESAARRVEVKAGEVANARFVMKAIPVSDVYFLTLQRNYLIHVDHDYINFFLRDANANVSVLYSLRCSPCWYVIHYDAKPKAVLSEASWPPSALPLVNTQAYNDFYKGWTDNSYGTRACFIALVNSGSVPWTETCVKDIQKETKLKVFINGGFTSVSFEQRVSTWTSFAYDGEFPENFTALPPK